MPRRKLNPAPNISSESITELIEILSATTAYDCSLSMPEINSDGRYQNWRRHRVNIMFASLVAAREVAYMLRGDWDELNTVAIYQPDTVALQNALALVKLELGLEDVAFCHVGECCPLENKGAIHVFEGTRSGKSRILADFLLMTAR